MLKKRLIPCMLIKDFILVKSIRFDYLRNVGSPISVARVFNSRDVDELILLDIMASLEGRGPNLDLLLDITDECFMPLTVGGGVRGVEDIRSLLRAGADKASINTSALETPDVIRSAAKMFGSQCIVVSIDAKKVGNSYEVFSRGGKKPTGLDPVSWAKRVEELGAGEILLTSIDRDGTKEGYDLELVKAVSDAVSVPVIASGGAGVPQDFVDCVKMGDASAVAAASIFLFTQYTPLNVKKHMLDNGIDVRV